MLQITMFEKVYKHFVKFVFCFILNVKILITKTSKNVKNFLCNNRFCIIF